MKSMQSSGFMSFIASESSPYGLPLTETGGGMFLMIVRIWEENEAKRMETVENYFLKSFAAQFDACKLYPSAATPGQSW